MHTKPVNQHNETAFFLKPLYIIVFFLVPTGLLNSFRQLTEARNFGKPQKCKFKMAYKNILLVTLLALKYSTQLLKTSKIIGSL